MYNFSTSLSLFIKTHKTDNQTKEFTSIVDSIKERFEYSSFQSLISENNIDSIKDFKLEALNWLIDYANFILEDGIISEIELQDFTFLKRIFAINEGDFIRYKSFEVKEILKKEFIRIYSDNYVNDKEKLLGLNLQALFDYSYDEFESLKREEVIIALIEGANPRDLDIAIIPKGFSIN